LSDFPLSYRTSFPGIPLYLLEIDPGI